MKIIEILSPLRHENVHAYPNDDILLITYRTNKGFKIVKSSQLIQFGLYIIAKFSFPLNADADSLFSFPVSLSSF